MLKNSKKVQKFENDFPYGMCQVLSSRAKRSYHICARMTLSRARFSNPNNKGLASQVIRALSHICVIDQKTTKNLKNTKTTKNSKNKIPKTTKIFDSRCHGQSHDREFHDSSWSITQVEKHTGENRARSARRQILAHFFLKTIYQIELHNCTVTLYHNIFQDA